MNRYQVKINVIRGLEDGKHKTVSEQYLIQASSFGEAESRIQEEIGKSTSETIDVISVTRKKYAEVIKNDDEGADKWYQIKVNFITLDEKNGKEKRTAFRYLVNASNAIAAHEIVDIFMHDTTYNYEIEQVDETKILDVFNEQ